MISTDWLAVELAKHVCCSSFDVVRSLNCQACDLLACQGLLRAVKPKRFGGVTFSAYPRIGVSVAFILQYRLVWLLPCKCWWVLQSDLAYPVLFYPHPSPSGRK